MKGLERGTALKLFGIPIIASVSGFIGNSIFLTQLADPESASGAAIFLGSAATTAKLALTAITVLLVVYYLYGAISKRNRTASA